MILLRPKSDADLKAWIPMMWADYRESILSAGFSSEEADLNIERNEKTLFVDGMPNDEQHFFDVVDDETIVGTIWLAEGREGSPSEWFVYDIVIDEEFRGKGLGRSTMLAAEDYVKSHGGTKLALNVFGYNVIARGLYESMGYSPLAIGMRKDLV
ncbi:MAG TPA: GNAT family N-acetyltransferase [Acidimicrobiales bacterium]